LGQIWIGVAGCWSTWLQVEPLSVHPAGQLHDDGVAAR
jgi:hypothetical protein